MTNKWKKGKKNAQLNKVNNLTLSVFLLMTEAWTANARNGDSSETPETQQSKVRIAGTVVDLNGETATGAIPVTTGIYHPILI
jgi:hypothetical protein